MSGYFYSITNQYDYLTETPKKGAVIANANKAGRVSILPDSNNRAVIIDDGEHVFLQPWQIIQ